MTGVQRYVFEMVNRLGDFAEPVEPARPTDGLRGHVWEQIQLPARAGRRLLWSPANTGPLSLRNQVLTVHDLAFLDFPEGMNPRFAAWYRFLVPRLARRVKAVITVSEHTRMRLLELTGLPPDRVKTVVLGVDDRFSPQAQDKIEAALTALGVPSRHYVLSLGSLEPRKNLGRLLQAWDVVQGDLPDDVWLVVAGGRGKSLVFKDVALSRLPPRVYLTGRLPDEHLPAVYSGALAMAYPSLYEGFGLPPLEAMACGTPVLTSDRTSLPEVVGEAGVMVNPHDLEALADGLRRLVEGTALRAEIRRKGLLRAQRFRWEHTAHEVRRILAEAASG